MVVNTSKPIILTSDYSNWNTIFLFIFYRSKFLINNYPFWSYKVYNLLSLHKSSKVILSLALRRLILVDNVSMSFFIHLFLVAFCSFLSGQCTSSCSYLIIFLLSSNSVKTFPQVWINMFILIKVTTFSIFQSFFLSFLVFYLLGSSNKIHLYHR